MPFNKSTPISQTVSNAAARAVIERHAPELLTSPYLADLATLPTAVLIEPPRLFIEAGIDGVPDPATQQAIWAGLAAIDSAPNGLEDTTPDPDYEAPTVPGGSAVLTHPATCPQWDVLEIRIDGPRHGNPFIDVELHAEFGREDARVTVGGFYDGDGRYLIRFMPDGPGDWSFTITSTARSMHGLAGSFTVGSPQTGVHGPVEVADTHHFKHRDGTRFAPLGTTAYAWTHQGSGLAERTLRTLAANPFNKLRMCLLPKSFLYNTNEPELFPFPGSAETGWDTERFVPEYFQQLDLRIGQLADLGIEADLILLHPYDRWGFSTLPTAAHRRLLTYTVRRLAAHRNVWWSMANEYDLLPSLTEQDWEHFAAVVRRNDHVGHLMSIHNWIELYDNGKPWITHCSIQGQTEQTTQWRRQWGKPVVIDECGYEGDLDQGWGNLTAQEMVHRSWQCAIRGGYTTHGETYLNDAEEIFWSKGGELVGESPQRLAFLADIVAQSPSSTVDPLPSGPFNWDVPYAGVVDQYYLAYLGAGQPRFRNVRLPAGQQYHVDVIDTWQMTIQRSEATRSGTFRVDLPARPYLALRFIRADI
jgi:hypothetical protein